VADRLLALHLAGVGLEPETRRSYLAGSAADSTLASNLLGFVNEAGKGQYGVEAYYQAELAGRNGSMSTYQDLTGREIVVGGSTKKDPVNGADLQLTIDADIQHAAEQALAAGVARNKAESGSVLVMDPKTGAIVAWADYPTYNANNFGQTPVDRFIDPIASHLYEPGSTMKVVTLSGAIDNHAITPTMTLNDPGRISVGGVTLYDWDRQNRGTVTYTKVLESSAQRRGGHGAPAGGQRPLLPEPGQLRLLARVRHRRGGRVIGADQGGGRLPALRDGHHLLRAGHQCEHGPDDRRAERGPERRQVRPAPRRGAGGREADRAVPGAAAAGDLAGDRRADEAR